MNKKLKNNIFLIDEVTKEEKSSILSMKGNQKIWNYFLYLLREKSFQKDIKTIKKYNLINKKPKDIDSFRNAINNLCKNFGLDEVMWSSTLENYILKKKLPKENLSTPCIVLDRIEAGEDEYPQGYFEDDPDDIPKESKQLDSIAYIYPVIIRVSQYASEREILDYIRKSYTKYIKPIQKDYQNKNIRLGQIRKKKPGIQERDDFIYKNKGKTYKEIASLLGKKNIFPDEGLIGKVISRESKKRN